MIFVRKMPEFYVIIARKITNVTDGQTTCDRKTALCTKVHCAVMKLHFATEFHSNLPSTSKAREDDVDGFPDTLDFETE